jgi:hypothetical protein
MRFGVVARRKNADHPRLLTQITFGSMHDSLKRKLSKEKKKKKSIVKAVNQSA